jgi:hypothetical protein
VSDANDAPEELLEAVRALAPAQQTRMRETLVVMPEQTGACNPMAMMQQMMARMGSAGIQNMLEQMASH